MEKIPKGSFGMRLSQLTDGVACTLVQGSMDTEITDIVYDSRRAAPGTLFVCIVGTQRDSHDYAAECVQKGAAAIVIQHDIDLSAVPGAAVLKVESSRLAMALMSANLFGRPAEHLTMIGVTGTKGKTTTTHMIKSVLEAAGRKVGMIGTNGIYCQGKHRDTANTTPESYELQKTFREFLDAGCDTALMEVSSQGLMMDRVAGIHYQVGVFTNLSPDHIGPGEHKTFEEYRSWKGQLFKRCDVGIVNSDDENTDALLEGHTCKLITYGRGENAQYRAGAYQLLRSHDFLGVTFPVTGADTMQVKVNMPGEFSVYNALAALCVGKVLGVADAAIHKGLEKCVVKGRVELVPISRKFTILLDYAHNEVSTESLLETLRAYHPKRLVVVFGCGGNRSKLRRYGMGEVCARMADFSILTEDNNRFEKVEDILADIRVGMQKGNPGAKYVEIPDRLDALHYAVDHAEEGDLIAVIGKGHEAYRDRMGEKTPFLERELLEEYAAQIGLE
jgi:UDP-N-acetylmuramoyl-L-alanyl-D-glutamate--2,6-diaminopimelate ligase